MYKLNNNHKSYGEATASINLTFLSVFLLAMALLISSCQNPAATKNTVSFYTAGGTAIACQVVPRGGTLEPVDTPRRTGFIFLGWYKDAGHTYRWDFENSTVTGDKTLHARWRRSGGGGGGGGASAGGGPSACPEGCRLCMEACPNGAIKPYSVDSFACASYLTQKKDSLSFAERALVGEQLYGCDLCQACCPMNKIPGKGPLLKVEPAAILALDEGAFRARFGHTALTWRGLAHLQRNAKIVLDNMYPNGEKRG